MIDTDKYWDECERIWVQPYRDLARLLRQFDPLGHRRHIDQLLADAERELSIRRRARPQHVRYFTYRPKP